ncbi:recombination protein RecR [Candidatus Saccharibacteria bacterium]|nr:recombination protein RecR [Candidatus Saccharibacteria bacterium]
MNSDVLPESVNKLIEEFAKLPSIGPKTAERLVFYLLKSEDSISLGEAALTLKDGIVNCQSCQNFSTETICKICQNPNRSDSLLCVVSQPLDIVAIEKTGLYKGKYHVLHGVISPVDGIGPDELEIDSLLSRIEKHKPEEIILATNPNLEGETTALYILRKLQDSDIQVTKLAHGLPMGGDLEYADQMTLGRALDNRQVF